MTNLRIGELLALATAVCWAISSIAFEGASRRAGSLPVNLIRLAIAFAGLCAVGLLGPRHRALPTDAPADAWAWLAVSGVVGFFIGDLALFRALVLMGARLTMLLQSLAPPIAALVGAYVLGERLTWVGWIGMALTLAGVTWVVSERTRAHDPEEQVARHAPPRAVLLALVGAIGQAVGLVLAKRGMRFYEHPFAATQIRAAAGIVGFALLIVALRDTRRVVAALRDGRAMALLTLGAVAGPFLGVSLLLVSLQMGLATGIAQTLTSLVPVLVIPFVVLVRREHVTWRAVLGAFVAVGGVAVLFYGTEQV